MTEGKQIIFFEPLPTFPPELFLRVSPVNAMKSKHFHKGVEQLAQEGAIQVYKNEYNDVILGAVGALQFEVFEYRLKHEYNSEILMESIDYNVARWVKTDNARDLKKYQNSRCMLVFDRFERPLLLFANQYTLDRFKELHEELELVEALDVNKEIRVE